MVTSCNQLIFIIAMLIPSVGSFQSIEFCQKMTIQMCAPNFHEIFQALEQRTPDQLFEKCTEVQV